MDYLTINTGHGASSATLLLTLPKNLAYIVHGSEELCHCLWLLGSDDYVDVAYSLFHPSQRPSDFDPVN